MTEHTIESLQGKLERLIAERRAWYRRSVNKGTLASDVAVQKDNELSAIQRIWSTWADHAPELREMWPEIKRRRLERKMREQNATASPPPTATKDWIAGTTPELEKHPAVAEARAAFPGATLSHRPLQKPEDGLADIEEDAA